MPTAQDLIKDFNARLRILPDRKVDPTPDQLYRWINHIIYLLIELCADNDSHIGRKTGTFKTAYISASTISFTNASPSYISDSASGFLTAKFAANQQITVKGSSSNDGSYTIATAIANKLTLISTDSLTTEAAGNSIAIAAFSYPDFVADIICPDEYCWIEKLNDRIQLNIATQEYVPSYSPDTFEEPERFYMDESNNIYLLSTPDAIYTIKFPYWYKQTVITAPTSTIPFKGLFDEVIIESLLVRATSNEPILSFQQENMKGCYNLAIKTINRRKQTVFQTAFWNSYGGAR